MKRFFLVPLLHRDGYCNFFIINYGLISSMTITLIMLVLDEEEFAPYFVIYALLSVVFILYVIVDDYCGYKCR